MFHTVGLYWTTQQNPVSSRREWEPWSTDMSSGKKQALLCWFHEFTGFRRKSPIFCQRKNGSELIRMVLCLLNVLCVHHLDHEMDQKHRNCSTVSCNDDRISAWFSSVRTSNKTVATDSDGRWAQGLMSKYWWATHIPVSKHAKS